jgi:hypothetical protein
LGLDRSTPECVVRERWGKGEAERDGDEGGIIFIEGRRWRWVGLSRVREVG